MGPTCHPYLLPLSLLPHLSYLRSVAPPPHPVRCCTLMPRRRPPPDAAPPSLVVRRSSAMAGETEKVLTLPDPTLLDPFADPAVAAAPCRSMAATRAPWPTSQRMSSPHPAVLYWIQSSTRPPQQLLAWTTAAPRGTSPAGARTPPAAGACCQPPGHGRRESPSPPATSSVP